MVASVVVLSNTGMRCVFVKQQGGTVGRASGLKAKGQRIDSRRGQVKNWDHFFLVFLLFFEWVQDRYAGQEAR